MRPVGRALTLTAGFLAVVVAGGLLLRAALPDVDGQVRALLVVEVLFLLSLAVAPHVATWSALGVNAPSQWRERQLLLVPLAVAALPLVGGVESPGTATLLVLLVGYGLTGFTEELVWRGIALHLLEPLRPARAVVLGAALFGVAHLGNVLYRDSVGLVLAQAWGAFCFGVAYGALRLRTHTIVPLMALHALTDLAAAVGRVPTIPVLVAEDVVLLVLGTVLLHRRTTREEVLMITQLDRALTTTAAIVAAVPADRWSSPSLCAGWTLRAEANHLVGGLRIFTAQLSGTALDADHDGHDWLGASPAASYDDAAGADREAWSRPDALDTTFDLAFGRVPGPMALVVHVTEVVVHGIDLAVAVGREDLVDEAQAAWLLGLMQQMGTEAFRVPGIFGPAVAAAPDEAPHRQLLAYLGRELTPVAA